MVGWCITGACAYSRAMADGRIQGTKRCVSCGGDYLLAFFRPTNTKESRSARSAQHYRDRCIGCETRLKKEEQADQRFRSKAKGAMRRHAMKLKEKDLIKSQADLEELYGWSIDRMMEDIKRVLREGCSYCLQKIDVIEQGLGVVTLDILDPQNPPHYSTNVKWCCARCNSEKQRTPPDVWGARRSMWDRWRRHQDRVEGDPEAYGFLALTKKADRPPLF